jgi:uncharacterized membrane-anchored protein
MKTIHVPSIDARYWTGITMASVFGTNTGDLFAFRSGLGILGGLPILAALVAAIYFLERRDSRQNEVWYWLIIIIIRTGATNIADFVCGRRFLGVDRIAFSAALAVFIFAMAVSQRGKNSNLGLPQTDAHYWSMMLAAGVLGTAAGDAVLGAFGGPAGAGGVYASCLLGALLAALLVYGRGGRVQLLYYYWLTICVARTTGTAIADMLAENQRLNIGLSASTILTGMVFVAVLVFLKSRPKHAPLSTDS